MGLIIAANWKMHKTAAETREYCAAIVRNEKLFQGLEVLICPPFTALSAASAALEGSSVRLGAQNMHWEKQGAHTGEIAAQMLLEFGVEYVIIGHSERRHLMGEDDDQVRRKVKTALESNLKPILCVGESETEREKDLTETVIEKQLAVALNGLEPHMVENMVVAYEPVWAIGTGRAASEDDAESAALLINNYFLNNFGEKAAAGLRVQYGGSVKAGNIDSFLALPSVMGALVGGASLEAGSFTDLLQASRKAV